MILNWFLSLEHASESECVPVCCAVWKGGEQRQQLRAHKRAEPLFPGCLQRRPVLNHQRPGLQGGAYARHLFVQCLNNTARGFHWVGVGRGKALCRGGDKYHKPGRRCTKPCQAP